MAGEIQLNSVTLATESGGVASINSSVNIKGPLNASGSAPIYACRAWVNFNGTGTVAIRASGNVSSVTDNGPGQYTVNFTTAMPDANYSITLGSSLLQNSPYAACINTDYNVAPTTSGCKIVTTVTNGSSPNGVYSDRLRVFVSIFR